MSGNPPPSSVLSGSNAHVSIGGSVALAGPRNLVVGTVLRLLSRQGLDRRERYPELAGLAGAPAGTVLDGEIVVLHHGQPDFQRLQAREHERTSRARERLARAAQRGCVEHGTRRGALQSRATTIPTCSTHRARPRSGSVRS